MKNDGTEKPLMAEDLIKMYEGLQKDYSKALKEGDREKNSKQLWRFIALAILGLWLYKNEHNWIWVPDPNDRQMRVEHSNWWGFKKQTFYPVWRKPSGEEQEPDSQQWCIKYPDGTWQVFLKDDMENIYYEWPEKGYSSPQKK